MKKFILSFALVLMALPFTSCTDDEPVIQEEPVKETIQGKDLISSTITLSQNEATYIETADYTFNIERTSKEAIVSVVANDVKFDSHMPYAVTFAMESIKATTFDENTIEFHASSVKFLDATTGEENTRYKLTDVHGYIDKKNGVYSLVYTVNGTWKVLVTSSTIRSRVADNDYTAPTDIYYIYKIDVATMKAEVFLHNIQFKVGGASSPVLKKISIPDLDVTPTATGFDLSGDNIVPFNYSGTNLDQATPMPPMNVTNYNGKIDLIESMHTIYFNSMGGEWDGFSALYLWRKISANDLSQQLTN
ncbi:MAG: hypothetical protein IKW83_08655 [Muribaculaceae bacterium]|nr:hypothetical protein [Muribaculaceae bacterium]